MPKKIMVVEDDPVALTFAEYTLQHAGYDVITVANGLEALKRAQKDTPDLIVLDVMLPGVDGFEVCRLLRSKEVVANVPILILSAKARESDKDIGLKEGANEYLSKPTSPAELVASVERLLAEKDVVP